MFCQQRGDQPNAHLIFGWDPGALQGWPSAQTWTLRDRRWATRTHGRVREGDGCDRRTSGIWRVSSYGQGAVRLGIANQSLSYAQLSGSQPIPVSDQRTQMPGPFWLDLQVTTRGMPSSWRVNAGQVAYVYGDDVSIGWWGPPSTQDLGQATGNLPVSGIGELLALETLLFVDIAEVDPELDVDTGYLRLTESYFVPAASSLDVVVPLGARTVQISTSASADTTGQLVSREFAAVASRFSIGAIEIVNNMSVKVDIGGETQLRLPATGLDNLWTLDWGIQTG